MRLLTRLSLFVLSLSLVTAQSPAPPAPGAPAPAAPTPGTPTPAAPTPGTPAPAVPAPAIPAPGAPGVPIPDAVPAAPAGAPVQPAAAQPRPGKAGLPLSETLITEPIEKTPLNGAELATLYREYTGRRVIVSAAAAAQEFAFDQPASKEDPLTYGKAAELLRIAAQIEGFVFMPCEEDANLEILGLNSRVQGKLFGSFNENEAIPEGDKIITYTMTFKHIKPEIAAQAFTQIIGQFGTYGSITVLNSRVLITENASLIRRLVKLKEEIDVDEGTAATRFISVKYADVTELAATLNELIGNQQQAQKSATQQRASVSTPPPAAPGGAPGQPGQAAAAGTHLAGGGPAATEDIPVQIIPEPRTNRVFIMGRPVDILFVEGLIREFDVETSEKTFLRRKLRFLAVADFLPVAENALNRAFSSEGSGSSGGSAAGGGALGGAAGGGAARSNRATTSGSSRTSSSNRNSSSMGSTGSFGGGTNSFGGMGGGSTGGGMGGGGASLGEPNVTTAPESRLVGRTLLVADNITNSIVVQGPPSGLEIVERLLDQIDVKADQVMISTVIGQLNLTNDKQFGVDYFLRGSDVLSHMGGGILSRLATDPVRRADGTVDNSTSSDTISNYGLNGGGLRAYGTAGDLTVLLKAVQQTGDFTVLARPSIFTSNSQKGLISSGERIAIPTGSNSYGTGNASTQIQYQDVVLKLEVIPLINDADTITLEIALLSDEVNGTQEIQGAGANGNNLVVPKITTREILTTVTIPNNNTIVLGGLITTRKGKDVTGIPILSSIPVLGKLFANTTDTDERAELLVFIQPSIVSNRTSLDNIQADNDNRYRITPSMRSLADGPGVLPPVDAIQPTADKAPSEDSRSAPDRPTGPVAPMKKDIRPVHRR